MYHGHPLWYIAAGATVRPTARVHHMNRKIAHLTVLAGVWILILPGTAWAYIDPGTGSYLFQLVIAGGLAALYTLRRYWQNVKTMLAGVLGRKRESTADPSDGVD